jgi:hypothetical protein
MAKRKGKSHETQTAEAVTDTVKPAVSPEHAEQSAAPVVAGDDRATGAPGRSEHPDGAPSTAGLPDATAVADGAGEPDAAPAGEAAEGVASAALHESGGVSDEGSLGHSGGAGAPDGGEQHDATADQPDRDGEPGADGAGRGADGGSPDGAAPVDRENGSAGAVQPTAGADLRTGDASAASSSENSDLKAAIELAGCKDLEDLVDMATIGNHLMSTISEYVQLEGPLKDWAPAENPIEIVGDLYDMLVEAQAGPSICTCPLPRSQPLPIFVPEFESGLVSDGITLIANDAGCHAHWLLSRIGVPVPDRGLLSLDQGQQLYEFVAKIRESATPTVLASQLVILKHRQTQDINWAQSVTLEVFAALSMIFLKREEEIMAEQRALLEGKAEPVPVPIDETTMEPVDDPLATWER